MKQTKLFILIVFLLTFYACEPPDDDNDNQTTSTVYLEDSYAAILKLNGLNITPTFQDSSTSIISNVIDITNLNNTNISSFNTSVAAPIDNTVSINATLESAIIVLKSGEQVPPFYDGGSVGNILTFVDDDIDRQEFFYNFTYPSNANQISISGIANISLTYGFEYTDNSSGNIIHSKTLSHTITFEGGSGNGGNCNNEIQSVNPTDITFGDACGSSTSVRLFYTNNSSISIRLRFTVVDENGQWSGQNLGFILDPGETTNQHFCTPKYVNNQFCYQILIKDVNSTCEFPDVSNIPVCNGF